MNYVTDVKVLKQVLQHARARQLCCHCKFWDQTEPPEDGFIDYLGFCRRYPPDVAEDGLHGWRLTQHFDWCGEYQLTKSPDLAQYILSLEKKEHAQPADEQP